MDGSHQLVAYYRVSTQKQGRSGLGLEAQRAMVEAFAREQGQTIAAEFVEVETGKGWDILERRPVLTTALNEARRRGCKICVAKLDRLSRNVHFISGLMARGSSFVVAELGPDVDDFVLHLFAALAEKERDMIARRTREGLAAAKRRGKRLGNPLSTEALRKAAEAKRAIASKVDEFVLPAIRGVQARGITSARGIAAELDKMRVPTVRGKNVTEFGDVRWSGMQVARILARAVDESANQA